MSYSLLQPLMENTLNGAHGENVASHVGEGYSTGVELVPTHHHRMEGQTAMSRDQLKKNKNATQKNVVRLYCLD